MASPRSVRLVQLPAAAMTALLDGDLAGASEMAGVPLTPYLMTDAFQLLWRLRIDQLAVDPDGAPWNAYVAVAEPEEITVGHAGFHGPPNSDGMVEIGYSVDPAHRRQGYAKAMLRALLVRAAAEPGVTTVRASISPDNAASLATIAGFGFTRVGEQWDEEDGLEFIFEAPAGRGAGTVALGWSAADPVSGLSEEPMSGVRSVTQDCRDVPECPPGSATRVVAAERRGIECVM